MIPAVRAFLDYLGEHLGTEPAAREALTPDTQPA
jgi:hypothetical protein